MAVAALHPRKWLIISHRRSVARLFCALPLRRLSRPSRLRRSLLLFTGLALRCPRHRVIDEFNLPRSPSGSSGSFRSCHESTGPLVGLRRLRLSRDARALLSFGREHAFSPVRLRGWSSPTPSCWNPSLRFPPGARVRPPESVALPRHRSWVVRRGGVRVR